MGLKRPNREINIFNLSMLDVISGALGAFLIIMIVLFPYYQKESIDFRRQAEELAAQLEETRRQAEEAARRAEEAARQAEEARSEAEAARAQAEAAEARAQAARAAAQNAQEEIDSLRRRAETAERALAKAFMVVYIRWDTNNQDVDLHVADPSGAEFYYQKRTIPGRPGELSEDSQRGPGNEIWEVHDAAPGEYKIYANLYSRHNNPENPLIKGRVIHRDGSFALPDTRLTAEKRKVLMATVRVNPDGGVERLR